MDGKKEGVRKKKRKIALKNINFFIMGGEGSLGFLSLSLSLSEEVEFYSLIDLIYSKKKEKEKEKEKEKTLGLSSIRLSQLSSPPLHPPLQQHL